MFTHRFSLNTLGSELSNCHLCPRLVHNRTQAVPGRGSEVARLVLVGEAPGQKEDRHGEPFIGAAGKLLDRALVKLNLDRRRVYITNAVKCRPPNNATPTAAELNACYDRMLVVELQSIAPTVVVTMGKTALHAVYPQAKMWMSFVPQCNQVMRGRAGAASFYLVPIYHPAFVLRQPDTAKEWFQGIKLAAELLGR